MGANDGGGGGGGEADLEEEVRGMERREGGMEKKSVTQHTHVHYLCTQIDDDDEPEDDDDLLDDEEEEDDELEGFDDDDDLDGSFGEGGGGGGRGSAGGLSPEGSDWFGEAGARVSTPGGGEMSM